MSGLTNVLWAPDGWPHLLLWAPNGWPRGGFPFVCGRLTADPTFSCGRLTSGPTEVSPIRLNLSSRLWARNGCPHLFLWAPDVWPQGGSHHHQSIVPSTPTYLLCVRSDLPPEFFVCLGGGGWCLNHFPLAYCRPRRYFSLCPRHPTHSLDYNSNVLFRIPGHRLALILSLIIPTTDYVIQLEHEPLRCGAGINKHIQVIPRSSPDIKGASIYFTLSAVASFLLRIITRSTHDRFSFCCSFHSWSVPKISPQVYLDLFLLQKLPFCALINALGVILM